MSKIYDINYRGLVTLLLPTFLRGGLVTALLRAAVQPVVYLKSRFDLYRRDTDYRLHHNGQTCRLRKVLNDYFDPLERRIYISEAEINRESTVIYMREVERWKIVPQRPGALILNRRGFGGISGYDFVVNVPAEYAGQRDRINAITNIYKLVSKRYLINYF
ncbi:MAG: hypothetical protein LBD53_01045 [Tannerella sp.]|jgi:hypothetical protein|nr:hypothetical protein [Tannerella sp.]